jgi:murein DD-endopeptidase MepM/ murein hydrolase activator NlpD
MIVPHAETKVFTFRLSTIAFQALCYVLVCLFLFMMILARSYQTMSHNIWELDELRLVNREQREQIEQLVMDTRALQLRMIMLDELDKQLREMMELESYSDDDTSLAALFSASTSGGLATTASASGTRGMGGGVLPNTAGVAVVSRTAILEAQGALNLLESMEGLVDSKEGSLGELRNAIAENMAYLSARPSIWPAFGYITSRFGYRQTVFGYEHHDGFDIANRLGTPIAVTADGTVTFAGWGGLYGNMVIVEHGYGWSTVYAHCSKLLVGLGDRVKRGEVVALMGSTGKSTGPHVHYEVRVNGRTVNPRYYLLGD